MEPYIQRCVTVGDIQRSYDNIKPYISKTPVLVYDSFNDKHGRNFFFKCENMQRTGSFKIRGAVNAVMKLKEKNNEVIGVVTHSSGNHGQAVALAAKLHSVPCSVVTPSTSPLTKQNAIKNDGAELILCEPTMMSRIETAKTIQETLGYHYISSCDDYDVITGQGSLGLEFLEQVPELDALIVSAAGGGMSAGVCLAAKGIKPELKVFIVAPENKQLENCLLEGKRLWPNPPLYMDTIADGLRQQQIGHRNWPILLQHAEKEVFSMTEDEIILGTKVAFHELKVVVEPSAGICVAAAMSSRMKGLNPSINNVGVVLCGGNADLSPVVSLMEGYREVKSKM